MRAGRLVVGLAAIVCAAAALLAGCDPSQPRDVDEELAYATCAEIARLLAKNPSTATVPRIQPAVRSQKKFRYEWSHGDGLSFTNGFGAKVDQTASCTSEEGHVSMFSINGKPIRDQQLTTLRVNALVRVSKSLR